MASETLMDIPSVASELGVSRSTLYLWLATGRGPATIRLPNGSIRIRRDALKEWLHKLETPPKEARS